MILWKNAAAVSAVILFPFLVTFLLSLSVDEDADYEKNDALFRKVLHFWEFVIILFSRIRLKTEGMDKIPEGRFLFVCNHRSNYDPLITEYMLKNYGMAFVSKPENFRIPVFGKIVRKCLYMPIDRENARNALKTVERAVFLLKNDAASVAVYPEGTRNKTEQPLLPFHNAVLKIAMRAEVPIVIGVMKNAETVAKRAPLRSTQVSLTILEVIEKEKIAEACSTAELGEHIRSVMLSCLG